MQTVLIRYVELADAASPRSARYTVNLRQLADGYSIEVQWGGAAVRKQYELYYRPTLSAAQEKFDRIIAAKTSAQRSSPRRYRLVAEGEQLSFDGFGA